MASLVDHIKPLRKGGTNDEKNLQSLCTRCHNKKTNEQDGGGWSHAGRGGKKLQPKGR